MNDNAVISHLLKTTSQQRFFDAVIAAGDIIRSKLNPEIFLKFALNLGSNPDNCVFVDDSIFGVKAAKTAEMGFIAVLTASYSSREPKKSNPDLIVNFLKEKTKMLAFIFQ